MWLWQCLHKQISGDLFFQAKPVKENNERNELHKSSGHITNLTSDQLSINNITINSF